MKPKKFDVIVIGAGSGLTISSDAAEKGLKVAVVEEGAFGGTCLNRGCIPSKILIHHADVMETIRNSEKFGIKSKILGVDWKDVQKRVWSQIDPDAKSIEEGNEETENITVYKTRGVFVDKKVLQVGKEQITADKVFICAGTRPHIPKIEGLDKVKYYTSDDVMRLKKQPKSMIVLGGGYIGCELGYFFHGMGTNVTIIARSGLVKSEDEEIAEKFNEIFPKKFKVMLGTNTTKISKKGNKVVVETEKNGKKKKIEAEILLVATGRIPNTDILDAEKTGVKTNKKGYVEVDEHMETNVKGIWTIGDIAGIYLFKHSANLEAAYASHNAFNPGKKMKVDYTAMPHAIFTNPQIAGVGMTEQELKKKKIKYGVGKYMYKNTGMGAALQDKDGFVKVLVDNQNNILGCHILGHDASTLIHEVIIAMKAGLGVDGITTAVHIHPALPEVVQRAFNAIEF